LLAGAGVAAVAGTVLTGMVKRAIAGQGGGRPQPIRVPLRVQPVFNCEIYARNEATSWRVTGAIQDEAELRDEEGRIGSDLGQMSAAAGFPLEVLPLVTVRNVEQATAAAKGDFDVLVIYAARRNLPVLEALAANDKWNLMFVRHRSGPLYYIYIGVHTHFVCGRPVFFCNPSLPRAGVVTVSHCTAPRRMDGERLEPVRILTHYESDYGAAPKVDMKRGQTVTVIDADFAGRRWLGFEAEIVDNPFFPICRTQLDLKIHGDWQRLLEEVRGFHWMLAYGSHLQEVGYAAKKAGLQWLAVT